MRVVVAVIGGVVMVVDAVIALVAGVVVVVGGGSTLQDGPLYPSGHAHINLKLFEKHVPPLIQGLKSHGPEVGIVTGKGVVTESGVVGRVVAGVAGSVGIAQTPQNNGHEMSPTASSQA